MTNWMVEIATSFNQKTVDLLAMTGLGRYFHPHLAPQRGIQVYPENTRTFFKVIFLEQLTRISSWIFTLILTFSYQGRRNSESLLRGTK